MLIRRIKHGFWWTALAAALLVALSQAWLWAGIAGQNRLIGQLLAGRDVAVEDLAHADPAVRLARAVYLRQAGRYDDALATLNLLLQQAPAALRARRVTTWAICIWPKRRKNSVRAVWIARRRWSHWPNRLTAQRWAPIPVFGMPNTIWKWRCACCRKWTGSTAATRKTTARKRPSCGPRCPDSRAVCRKHGIR